MSADAQDRAEEMEALEAIFGDDFRAVAADTFELRIALEGRGDVVMCCHLPETYPSRTAPLYEFRASWLTGADEAVLAAGLDSIAAASQGEVVVFKWAEFLREEFATLPANSGPPCASTPRPTPAAEEEGSHCDNMEGGDEDVDHNLGAVSLLPHSMHREDGSVSAETIAYWEARIKHGPPHTERKSTFQAHVADVKSEAEAKQMVAALLTNNKIARATHNIMAFRLMPDGGHARGDCDDDGESAAGGRLLHLLNILDVQNVCVVVSRWYGGILLGPDRFKLINNSARNLLVELGYTGEQPSGHNGEKRGGKKK